VLAWSPALAGGNCLPHPDGFRLQSDTVHWFVKIKFGGERIQGPALVNDHDREYFRYRSAGCCCKHLRFDILRIAGRKAASRYYVIAGAGGSEVVDRPPADHFQILPCLSVDFDGALMQSLFRLLFADAAGWTPCLMGLWKGCLFGPDREGGCAENKVKV
jgi:hypothetical protein